MPLALTAKPIMVTVEPMRIRRQDPKPPMRNIPTVQIRRWRRDAHIRVARAEVGGRSGRRGGGWCWRCSAAHPGKVGHYCPRHVLVRHGQAQGRPARCQHQDAGQHHAREHQDNDGRSLGWDSPASSCDLARILNAPHGVESLTVTQRRRSGFGRCCLADHRHR
jgi:hypothetical protein